jgi:hypothetical protein
MPLSIQDFKVQNPDYKDVPDQELADKLHEKFYPDMDKDEFYDKVGVNTQQPQLDSGKTSMFASRSTGQPMPVSTDDPIAKAEATVGTAISAPGMAVANIGQNVRKVGDYLSGTELTPNAYDANLDTLNNSREAAMNQYPVAKATDTIAGSLPVMGGVGGLSEATGMAALGKGSGLLSKTLGTATNAVGEGAAYGAAGEAAQPSTGQSTTEEAGKVGEAAKVGVYTNSAIAGGSRIGDAISGIQSWFGARFPQAGQDLKAAKKFSGALDTDATQRLEAHNAVPKDQRPYNLTTAEAADSPQAAELQAHAAQQQPLPIESNGETVQPRDFFTANYQNNKDALATNAVNAGDATADKTALGTAAENEVGTQTAAINQPVTQDEAKLAAVESQHAQTTSALDREVAQAQLQGKQATTQANTQVTQAKQGLTQAADDTKNAVASDLTTKERTSGSLAGENTKLQYIDELNKQKQAERAAYAGIDPNGDKMMPVTNTAVAASKVPANGDIDALLTDKDGNRIMDKYRGTADSGPNTTSDLGTKQLGIKVNDSSTPQVSVKQVTQDITDLNAVMRKHQANLNIGNNANKGLDAQVVDAARQAKSVLEQTLNDSTHTAANGKPVGQAYQDARDLVAKNNEELTRSDYVSRTTTAGGTATNDTPLDLVKDRYLAGKHVGDAGKTILDNPESTFPNMSKVTNGAEYVKQQILAHAADKLGDNPSVASFDKVFDDRTRKAMLNNGMKQQHDEIMGLRNQLQDSENGVKSAQDNFNTVNENTTATLQQKQEAQKTVTKASQDAVNNQKELLAQTKSTAQAKQKDLEKSVAYKMLDKETGVALPPEAQARMLMDNPQYQDKALELARSQNDSGLALRGLGESVHDTILADSINNGEGFQPKYDNNNNRLYYNKIDPVKYDSLLDKNAAILKEAKGEQWFSEAKQRAQVGRIMDDVANAKPAIMEAPETVSDLQGAGAKGIAQKVTKMSYTALNSLFKAFGHDASMKFETAIAKIAKDPDYGLQVVQAYRKAVQDAKDIQPLKDLINKGAESAKNYGLIQAGAYQQNKGIQDNGPVQTTTPRSVVKKPLDNEVNKVYNKSENSNSGGFLNALNPISNADAAEFGPGKVGGRVPLLQPVSKKNIPIVNDQSIVNRNSKISGVPPAYFNGMQHAESGNKANPDKTTPDNDSTSAVGRYQFTSGTWNTVRTKHPELHLPPITPTSDPRTNEKYSTLAMARFTADNYNTIKDFTNKTLGHNPNMADLHGAHVMGAGGFMKFAAANPQIRADKIVPAAAKNNPGLFYEDGDKKQHPRTVQQVYTKLQEVFLALNDQEKTPGWRQVD